MRDKYVKPLCGGDQGFRDKTVLALVIKCVTRWEGGG